jgi:hypothetical protein
MVCGNPCIIRSFDASLAGLKTIYNGGINGADGYSVTLEWHKNFIKPITTYTLVYNIYYSSIKADVFAEGVKFVAPSTQTSAVIQGVFKPGDVYYFAVTGSGHEKSLFTLEYLPSDQGLYIYPEAALVSDITATDTIIPIDDASLFPPYGIIIIGAELIKYTSKDLVNNTLILESENDRGVYGYEARPHSASDGYDGVRTYDNPFVSIFRGWENQNNAVGMCEVKFQHQYAVTELNGYREINDIVSGESNLELVDTDTAGYLSYDNAGWRRTYLPDYLAGKCIGSYFGGEYGCADGYETDGSGIRGLGVQDHMLMREEYLITATGKECSLFKRMRNGKQSQHYESSKENTAYRGVDNYGTTMVGGYEQFFNPRRSDGRIMVRFGPTKEDYKRDESGLENTFIPDCWCLTTPTIQDGDFIIRYNKDGSEEWRYEIIDVTRNDTLLSDSGMQKFTAVRVRKTDPIYQVRAFRDTAMYPREILTGLGGNANIPYHVHRIQISEKITTPTQINQMTSVERGHNHAVVNGVIKESGAGSSLQHGHSIIF